MTPHTPPHPEVLQSLAFALVAASTTPLLLLDNDLNVVTASASFCIAFRADPARVTGVPLSALGDGEWNIAAACRAAEGYHVRLCPGRGL